MDAKKKHRLAVGYDNVPQTTSGKALGIITSILDIGFFVLPAGILSSLWRSLYEVQEGA